jgi:hypothetical protein
MEEDIRDLSTTLVAGVIQAFRQYAGNVLYLDTATSPVLVSFDNKSEVSLVQGQKIDIGYRGFTLKSLVGQSVVVKYGQGNFSNSNQNVSVTTSATVQGANTTKPVAEISIGAGLTIILEAANANRKMLRLAIPSSETGELYLTDALNTAKGGILEPGVIDYLDTEAAVYAHNYGAAAVKVSVLELERI